MVPALNPTGQDSPRTGVPAYLRGEILTPLPGDGPSLCDPLTGARRGGDVAGRSMRQNRGLRRPDNGRGCRHVTACLRRVRFAPTQSSRQTGQALTFGVCHAPCFKSVLPVPGRGRRFPSRVRVWPLPTIHK